MDVQAFYDFIALAQIKNFSLAAESLHSTQSTLSRRIMKLEEELGSKLISRTTRSVELTAYGRLFLQFAEDFVKIQSNFQNEATRLQRSSQEHVRIGAIPAIQSYRITNVLELFHLKHPGLQVELTKGSSDEQYNYLRQGTIELGFIRELNSNNDEFVHIPFDADVMVLIVNKKHPLAAMSSVNLSLLKNETFCLIDYRSFVYRICLKACVDSGFEPNIAYTNHNIADIIDFVEKGLGIALLMDKHFAGVNHPNLHCLSVMPSVATQINLCYLRGSHQSEAAKNFMKCALDVSV